MPTARHRTQSNSWCTGKQRSQRQSQREFFHQDSGRRVAAYIMRTATRSPLRTPSFWRPATRLCTCSFISPYDQRMQSLEEAPLPCWDAGSCFEMRAGRSAYFATAWCQNCPRESSQSGLSIGPETLESSAPDESSLVGCCWYADWRVEACRAIRLTAAALAIADVADADAGANAPWRCKERGGMVEG